ncbi:MAG TPA: isochorismate synthase [Acidimicrobiales bacterium]|nr:isochorismate synthase [Acidimicrobiales bacterium]
MSGLRARTRPVEAGATFDPFTLLGAAGSLYSSEALTLVGLGEAAAVGLADGLVGDAAGAAGAVLGAIDADDAVGRPGTGPLAMGALPYDRAAPGRLTVPALLYGCDAAGAWVTAVGRDPQVPDVCSATWVAAQFPPAPARRAVELDAITLRADPSPRGHVDAVASAVRAIAAGRLAKVVLARCLTLELPVVPGAGDVARRLHRQEPSCTAFVQPVPNGRFVGASPELLVSRRGDAVVSHPLAGTVGLDGAAASDAEASGRLLASAKDREEHQLVVEQIAAVLATRCERLEVPEAPSLVPLRTVAHLGTRIVGRLRPAGAGPDSVLSLVAALHPTAAVGGLPHEAAEAFIRSTEVVARDCWAGPVGWVDRAGDGDWVIGIRSALLGDGRVRLWGGGGIVAGSDPKSELDETTLKLRPVLEAVAPGSGELLSS